MLLSARDGSPEAIDRLFRLVGPRLLSWIRLRMGRDLRSRMESTDLLNATMLRAFAAFDSLQAQNEDSLMAWFVRIARSELHDRREHHGAQRRDLRKEAALSGDVDRIAADVQSQTGRLMQDQRMLALEEAIESLPEQQREVVILRQLEELSWAEIGARLNKKPDACRMLLARAMARLTLEMSA